MGSSRPAGEDPVPIEQRNIINKAMNRPPGYFSVPRMKGGWSTGSTDGLGVLENAGAVCHIPRISAECGRQ